MAALLALGLAASPIDVHALFGQWLGSAGTDLLGHTLGVLVIGSLTLALLLFPSGRFEPRWTRLGVPLILAVSLVNQLTGVLPWLGLPAAALSILLLGVLLCAIVTRYRSEAREISRQQIRFAVIGIGIAVALWIVGSLCDVGSAIVTDQGIRAWLRLGSNALFSLSLIALPLGLLMSLLRYRLFEAIP